MKKPQNKNDRCKATVLKCQAKAQISYLLSKTLIKSGRNSHALHLRTGKITGRRHYLNLRKFSTGHSQ